MDDNAGLVEEEKDKKISHKKIKKDDEVEALREKVKDLENQLLRSVADYRNLEKRLDEEKREFVKYANRDLLVRLIPAFDTLFLAEKYVSDEGIKLTIKHLQESLKDVGVERVEVVGKKYDPAEMEAVTTGEGEEDLVLDELRPGYTLNGKLVRPAQVKVGKSE
ncbi:MAG TPA: nucleotide exchange factor GrpE [Patescibacteria group bacterium]|nr:nucleotide exchange factor GrpE [Patescibacteria group bacterium]